MKNYSISRQSTQGSPIGIACDLPLNQSRSLSKSTRLYISTGLWMTILPVFVMMLAVVFEYSGFDIWWESFFFNEWTHSWPFRGHWLFEQVIHEGGRLFDIFVAVSWLIGFIITFFYKRFRHYQKPLLYFLVASATGPIIVGILKQFTHIYTPWDILPFYGPHPYIRLFDPVPNGLPIGQAFPAGHASGGYAFLSLYFLMYQLGIPHKRFGLAAGLFLGGLYGLGQQIRGAHFPSHDLFTMVICWYASFLIYYLFYPRQRKVLFHGPQ